MLNKVTSFQLLDDSETNYKNWINKIGLTKRYKRINFDVAVIEKIDDEISSNDFGQVVPVINNDMRMPYCIYDRPNNTGVENLICGLKHTHFIYIELPHI
jgi:hypothetical protein